jgi:hypothetical protein
MPHLEMRLLPSRASTLLLIIASVVGVGCASAGRTCSSLAQPASAHQWQQGHSRKLGSRRRPSTGHVDCRHLERRRPHPRCLQSPASGDAGIQDHDRKDSSVARSDVANIVGASDSSINDALIGASIGLAAAGIVLAAHGSGDGYVLPSAQWGAPLLLSAVGGLLGIAHRSRLSRRASAIRSSPWQGGSGLRASSRLSGRLYWEKPVSDRGTLEDVSQSLRSLPKRDCKLLVLKTERCPSG